MILFSDAYTKLFKFKMKFALLSEFFVIFLKVPYPLANVVKLAFGNP